MGLLLNLSLLVTCLSVLHVNGFEEKDYKRALRAFHLVQPEPAQEKEEARGLDVLKEKFQCKQQHEACRGLPTCCGELNCFWKDGLSPVKEGECVKCIEENELCQRDKACCGDMICDKGNPLWVNGRCVPKRSTGECYSDDQCAVECDKKSWFHPFGTCVGPSSENGI